MPTPTGSDGTYNFWDKDSKQRLKAMSKAMYGADPAPIPCGGFNADGSIYAYAVSYDWSRGFQHYNPSAMPSYIHLHGTQETEVCARASRGRLVHPCTRFACCQSHALPRLCRFANMCPCPSGSMWVCRQASRPAHSTATPRSHACCLPGAGQGAPQDADDAQVVRRPLSALPLLPGVVGVQLLRVWLALDGLQCCAPLLVRWL